MKEKITEREYRYIEQKLKGIRSSVTKMKGLREITADEMNAALDKIDEGG